MPDRDQRIIDVCLAALQNQSAPGHRGTYGLADYGRASEQIRQASRDYLAT